MKKKRIIDSSLARRVKKQKYKEVALASLALITAVMMLLILVAIAAIKMAAYVRIAFY